MPKKKVSAKDGWCWRYDVIKLSHAADTDIHSIYFSAKDWR